jgi:histone-lysine N-methyltransferase SUV39H
LTIPGLRAREDIKKGQFVDVYIGELLREPAAKAREEFRTGKDSFFFTLDKFRSDPDFDEREILIVDGEFYGNATRFMNHSCEPNCRQFAVILIPGLYCYTLAFFAKRDIPMYEELTFDYLDPEEDEPIDLDEIDLEIREPCLCGSHQCRKWLWS